MSDFQLQTVWIARHGNRLDFVKPEWFNTAARRYDPPLYDDGFIQARELGKRLEKERITQIFASPFLRTIQTANEVATILNLPIKLEAGLGEWHNPQWMSATPEIHPPEILKTQFPRIDWDYQSFTHPQYPESATEVELRAGKTARHLTAKFSGSILLVGHGASVAGAVRGIVPLENDFKVPLCSLSKLVKQDNNWQLELLADTAHLSNTETNIRLN